MQKVCLDVGCGRAKNAGFTGMDRRKLPGVDIVHDAEVTPWPLDDESCGVVVMSHFVEHVKPWRIIGVIDETWRVLEPDGVLLISTPYGGSARYLQDPTHCCPWVEATPGYFAPESPLYGIYEPRPWKIDKLVWSVYGDIECALRKLEAT